MDRRYVPIAEVARPHGVVGEIRLKVFNEESDLLLARPPVRLLFPDGTTRESTVTSARPNNKAMLVRLAGVLTRDDAEALRGVKVCVPRDTFPPLEEGEFYACDVVGTRAVLASGEPVGTVSELRSYPTCDVIIVERPGRPSLEVPLVEQFVSSVDIDAGVVHLVTVDGLT